MSVKLSTRQRIQLFFSALLVGGSVYFLCLVLAPQAEVVFPPSGWSQPVPNTPRLTENRLYIPALKLNMPYKSGDQSVLNNNVWYRYPERGNPQRGGNFILAGHRFNLGLTPGETKRKSPFYRLDLLKVNDKIYVDYSGERYEYTISKRFTVRPSDITIEQESKDAKMTLYSCTLGGTWDGRDVVVAKQTGRAIDPTQRF